MNKLNILTILKIPISFCIIILLNLPFYLSFSISFLFLIIIYLIDLLDIYFSKKYNLETKISSFVDAIFDKALINPIFFSLLSMGIFPYNSIILILLLIFLDTIISSIKLIYLNQKIFISSEFLIKLKKTLQIISISINLFNLSLYWDISQFLPISNKLIYLLYFINIFVFLISSFISILSFTIFCFKVIKHLPL